MNIDRLLMLATDPGVITNSIGTPWTSTIMCTLIPKKKRCWDAEYPLPMRFPELDEFYVLTGYDLRFS